MVLRRLSGQGGLTQKAAGSKVGVSLFTVIKWEYGYRRPAMKNWPAIVRFVSYNPLPTATPFRNGFDRSAGRWGGVSAS